MEKFVEYLVGEMAKIHYTKKALSGAPSVMAIGFQNPKGQKFAAMYMKQPQVLDGLKAYFQVYPSPILIVVDSDLLNLYTINDKWLRAIHALYWGRVYVWDGKDILAIHYDRQTEALTQSNPIQIKNMKFEVMDCWYREFPGKYFVAHFNDGRFWQPSYRPKEEYTKPPPRQKDTSYDDFWKQEFERQKTNNPNYSQKNEDVYEAFRQAYESEKARHQETPPSYHTYSDGRQYDTPWAKPPKPRGDQWFNAMMQGLTLDDAKAVYRRLAREWHPDTNKSPDATETMKAINVAFEKVVKYYS